MWGGESLLEGGVFKIPLYLINAMRKAGKEREQSLQEYADDLGAALLLGDTSVFQDSKMKAKEARAS